MWTSSALGVGMAAVWIGVLSTDSLCPEHRAWVVSLAVGGLVCGVSSIVGLVGRRWCSPFAALAAAGLGVGIGLIDMVHSPTRGAVTALAFAVIAVGAALAAIPQMRSLLWVNRTRRGSVTPGLVADSPVAADPDRVHPQPAEPAARG